jgi:hypothetical protein
MTETSPALASGISAAGEEITGRHQDTWYGAIVQITGATDWQIWDTPPSRTHDPATVTTWAGDILLIPWHLPHLVSTSADPGHSTHLAFALDRDAAPASLTAPAGQQPLAPGSAR